LGEREYDYLLNNQQITNQTTKTYLDCKKTDDTNIPNYHGMLSKLTTTHVRVKDIIIGPNKIFKINDPEYIDDVVLYNYFDKLIKQHLKNCRNINYQNSFVDVNLFYEMIKYKNLK